MYAIHHFKKQNGNEFLNVTSNTQVTKGKRDKLEFIKTENLCASKSLKKEPTEWTEMMFSSKVNTEMASNIIAKRPESFLSYDFFLII